MWNKCCWVIFLYFCYGSANAQNSLQNLEFGVHAGTAIYQGDLTPSTLGSYKTVRYAGGAHVNIIVSPSFSIRPNFDFGKLAGDDSKYNDKVWRQQRNFKFDASFKEVSALLVWDILGLNHEDSRPGFAPYLFGGIGYTFINSHLDHSRFNRQFFINERRTIDGLEEDLDQPELKNLAVVPLGGGVRFQIVPGLSIKAEANYRLSSTDYIDGFSRSADIKQNDRYYTTTIGLIFSPGNINKDSGIPCPSLKH